MINEIKLIPVTAASHPFATAVGKYHFTERGYVEEEYFMAGTANVYSEDDSASIRIDYADLPYCNRFLVRKPKDITKFSGNVLIEILNPTAAMDLDRMWVIAGKHFMRRGDIYIGITSKPDVLDALMKFDWERYSVINWGFPFERQAHEEPKTPGLPAMKADCETGLFWDMLTDLCLLIKSEDDKNPVREYRPERVLLTGWSQSAGYLCTYVNKLAFDASYTKGQQLFDGYFAAGGVHFLTIPLNQEGFYHPEAKYSAKINYMPVPFVAVQTETENALLGGYEARQDNSNSETLKYRIYEIPGPTHDTTGSLLDYYRGDTDVARIQMTPRYMGENEYPNDFPYEFPFHAAYEHFFRWVKDGIAPPCFERIEVDAEQNNIVDQDGNAIGGIRTPFLDYPTCHYIPYSDLNREKFGLFGQSVPFSPKQLKARYGSLAQYKELILQSTEAAILEGRLLEDDKEEIIKVVLEFASKRGLI